MSKNQELVQPMESDDAKFERLLAEAGLVKKVEKEILSPESRIEGIRLHLDLLKAMKEAKDERGAKKVRRILRKKFGFSIRAHQRVEVI